jgi:hypothetical protein
MFNFQEINGEGDVQLFRMGAHSSSPFSTRRFLQTKAIIPDVPDSFASKRAARAEASMSNSRFQEQSSTSSPVPGFTQNGPPNAKPGMPTKRFWDFDPHMLDMLSLTFAHISVGPLVDMLGCCLGANDENKNRHQFAKLTKHV